VPVKNGVASEDAPDRQRNDGALRPELAAVVAFLVPPLELPPAPLLDRVLPLPPASVVPLVLVLPPPALERTSELLVVDEVPSRLGTDPVPVLTTAPIPAVEPLELCGTLAIAVVPVVIAPGPLTVPAVAAPPADPLAALVMPVGFVLVSVVLPGGAFGFGSGTGVSVTFGRGTAPLPTWPAPLLPEVDPPTAGSPEGAACCAATGREASARIATARSSLILRQRAHLPRVPGRWPHGEPFATVEPARKDRKWPRRGARRPRRW
jgi:hypothetical protein